MRERCYALLQEQLATQLQRQGVMEVRYRTGQGSTDQMLRMWQRTEDLRGRMGEVGIEQGQVIRELEVLCRVEESDSTEKPEFTESP